MAKGKTPPLSPMEGWLSGGRQVLHFSPLLYNRWSQALEVTRRELFSGEPELLVRRRKEPEPSSRDLMGQTHDQHWADQHR